MIETVPQINALAQNADHIDIKTIDSTVSMREFIAGLLSYQPRWVTFLYHVRGGFVRLLGMKQSGRPHQLNMQPDEVPMEPGKEVYLFNVDYAEEDHYWIASAAESHLTAYLGVIVEPLHDDLKRFHVLTIVHYNSWAGPVYFNVIRPFHHIVVNSMMRAAVST